MKQIKLNKNTSNNNKKISIEKSTNLHITSPYWEKCKWYSYLHSDSTWFYLFKLNMPIFHDLLIPFLGICPTTTVFLFAYQNYTKCSKELCITEYVRSGTMGMRMISGNHTQPYVQSYKQQ